MKGTRRRDADVEEGLGKRMRQQHEQSQNRREHALEQGTSDVARRGKEEPGEAHFDAERVEAVRDEPMQGRPYSAEAEKDKDLGPRAAVGRLAVLWVEHDVGSSCAEWMHQ